MDQRDSPSRDMDITPESADIWAGIGGHFDTFTQILAELVDNSVANYASRPPHHKGVSITITDLPGDDAVQVEVDDVGTGIADLERAWRLGDRSHPDSPLNEHGFGFKHAIASADPSNSTWQMCTRTKAELNKGSYRRVKAPYSFDLKEESIATSRTRWPGSFNEAGTYVRFQCSNTMFYTLRAGVQGVAGFERCLDYLVDELGFLYSGVIKNGGVAISVHSPGLPSRAVPSIEPYYQGFYKPPSRISIDLGGGTVELDYKIGDVKKHLTSKKHYLANQSTSGVEVRINGRLIESNLFEDVWDIEQHPKYNHLLIALDIISNNPASLPRTRTSKNGIRLGDPKLDALFKWLRSTYPTPDIQLSSTVREKELVEELKVLKEKHIRSPAKMITDEFQVFKKLGGAVQLDLYVFDGHEIVLYEAKKDEASVQDVYQLLMYWDGAVDDGLSPAEGILIASSFSPAVDPIMARMNFKTDAEGKNYHFVKKTWTDEGVKYKP